MYPEKVAVCVFDVNRPQKIFYTFDFFFDQINKDRQIIRINWIKHRNTSSKKIENTSSDYYPHSEEYQRKISMIESGPISGNIGKCVLFQIR